MAVTYIVMYGGKFCSYIIDAGLKIKIVCEKQPFEIYRTACD
jgi:hypothetical protein